MTQFPHTIVTSKKAQAHFFLQELAGVILTLMDSIYQLQTNHALTLTQALPILLTTVTGLLSATLAALHETSAQNAVTQPAPVPSSPVVTIPVSNMNANANVDFSAFATALTPAITPVRLQPIPNQQPVRNPALAQLSISGKLPIVRPVQGPQGL